MNEDLESTQTEVANDDAVVNTDVNADKGDTDNASSEQPAVDETPAASPKKKQQTKYPTHGVVITPGADTDAVYLSKCVYKNKYARKSLTVHHLQRRLDELGYHDAGSDKDGWYGDLTKSAVAAFQKSNKLADTGIVDEETLRAIFDGDPNVTVVL